MEDLKKESIVVLGAGSFGTAMAVLFSRNGSKVTILDRNPERCAHIVSEHRNPDYLKDIDLPISLNATTDVESAFSDATIIFHAIPIQASRNVLQNYKRFIKSDVPIVSMSKGIHTESLQLMCDIITDIFGSQPSVYLSGPSFAKEICQGLPTGFTVASTDQCLARRVAGLLSADHSVRAWITEDVIGVEIGGALKNVYAIAAGILEGAGFGYNTAALLVTKGCHEMMALGRRMGARPSTLSGLAGVGDLMLTCFGPASRNRSVGVRLGRGETLESVTASMSEVAEGVPTLCAAVRLAASLGMAGKLPIMEAVYQIVHRGRAPGELMALLMRGKSVREENVLYGAGDEGEDVKMG